MARNTAQWLKRPNLPSTHYVDPIIYSSEEIFEEEKEKIFRKVWHLACHESELPNPGDFRTYRHPGGTPLVIVRGQDGKVRSFYNICPHRGNVIVYEPSGNAKNLTCIFHQWAFNGYGECVDIPRGKEGYQDRLCKEDVALKEVRTEVGFGGFVWVNLDDHCEPLAQYIGHALDFMLPELESEPLEIMWYYQATLHTNYKLIHDTNSEFYHDYLHFYNRVTGMLDPNSGYFQRKYTAFPNGHASVGSQKCNYAAYKGTVRRSALGWPHLEPGGWKLVDLFPAITFNLRTSVLRIDSYIPLAPNKVILEFRTLGLKSDTPEIRRQREKDAITIWGPWGRNLHEDLLASSGQGMAMAKGSQAMYVLQAREEDNTIHDEIGMRHFLAEWSRRMGRSASNPMLKTEAAARAVA
ncbi:aromatic ring-hydroxylating oxygenase subunit alpha [Pelomicrobium methylotrophicum]|uniref:Aromatic ring-hydroxylating dioxygenase subunit alpha n=1 Tax=Pelomicrobium methylotrophicum TaxID=2602750 RepID=A0A5C7ESP5_9PROT|nr:aromatic ring-hydroxylating dioxygenase subunit alpha [Pelomicrobium methylotrophicum]TXF10023.1 aromatic ring-hydroxylating dioxygenase subunit alpha [Pelomicrobium methylotrophicum]